MFTGLQSRLIGGATILLLILGGWLYVSNLQSTIKTLETDNSRLSDQVKTQNTAITKFKTEAESRLKDAKEELKVAQEEAAKIQVKSRIIYRTVPSKGLEGCENDKQSALDLLNAANQSSTLNLMNEVKK